MYLDPPQDQGDPEEPPPPGLEPEPPPPPAESTWSATNLALMTALAFIGLLVLRRAALLRHFVFAGAFIFVAFAVLFVVGRWAVRRLLGRTESATYSYGERRVTKRVKGADGVLDRIWDFFNDEER